MQISPDQLVKKIDNNQQEPPKLNTTLLARALLAPIQEVLQEVLEAFQGQSSKASHIENVNLPPEGAQVKNNGLVPFTFHLPKGKDPSDVYVRVQGVDPNTKKACYISFDPQGNPTYHDVGDPTTKDPSAYSSKLSDLPSTVNIPEVTSGNMFFSICKPLQGANPDRNNPSLPDYKTKWSMMEFTNNGGGITVDTTAVNSFGSPTLQMQMDSTQGEGPKIGYAGDPAALLAKAHQLIDNYAGSASEWKELFSGHDGINRISSPKFDNTFNHYYDNYLQKNFVPYYQTNDLYLTTRAGILRGHVSQDGKTFNFYDKEGALKASLPTTSQGSTRCWLTGAPGDWQGGTGDAGVRADLMRDLSSLLNSGMEPSKAITSQDHPITKEFFENASKSGLLYQASYNGKPMYDLYERVMHEAGYNGYAYDYDDMLGKDGTQSTSHENAPSFSVNINF